MTTDMSESRRNLVAMLFVMLVGLAIWLYVQKRYTDTQPLEPVTPAVTTQSSWQPPATPEAATPLPRALELEVTSWHWNPDGAGFVTLEGEVRNIGRSPLENVEAIGVWSDANGKFVTSENGMLEVRKLPVGATSPFKILAHRKPNMKRAKLQFILSDSGEALTSQDDQQ